MRSRIRLILVPLIPLALLVGCDFPQRSGQAGRPESKPAAGPERPAPAIERLGDTPPDSTVELTALAVSADGKRALTGYTPHKQIHGGEFDSAPWNVMRLWDLTGEPKAIQTYKHERGVVMVGFLPDGKRVVSAGDSTVRMWDMDSGKMLWSALAALNGNVKGAALSPDGTHVLAYGLDAEEGPEGPVHGRLRLIDASSGKLLRVFHQFDDAVDVTVARPMIFSPDSKLVYIGGSVLDIKTGEVQLQPASAERKAPMGIWALSPDGRFVSETREGTDFDNFTYHLVLRETNTGKVVRDFAKKKPRISGFPPSVYAASFSPDGKYVISADGDDTLRRWDVETGQEVWAVPGGGKLIAFSADGRLVLSVSGGFQTNQDAEYHHIGFYLWDATTGKRLR